MHITAQALNMEFYFMSEDEEKCESFDFDNIVNLFNTLKPSDSYLHR